MVNEKFLILICFLIWLLIIGGTSGALYSSDLCWLEHDNFLINSSPETFILKVSSRHDDYVASVSPARIMGIQFNIQYNYFYKIIAEANIRLGRTDLKVTDDIEAALLAYDPAFDLSTLENLRLAIMLFDKTHLNYSKYIDRGRVCFVIGEHSTVCDAAWKAEYQANFSWFAGQIEKWYGLIDNDFWTYKEFMICMELLDPKQKYLFGS